MKISFTVSLFLFIFHLYSHILFSREKFDEFDNVKNVTDNDVTHIVCDLVRIRKHNMSSFFIVYNRIWTVRHIRIYTIHRSCNVLWILTWVRRLLIFFRVALYLLEREREREHHRNILRHVVTARVIVYKNLIPLKYYNESRL